MPFWASSGETLPFNEFCKIWVENILDPVLNFNPRFGGKITCGDDRYECCCDSTECTCCEKIWVDSGWAVCRTSVVGADPRCSSRPLFDLPNADPIQNSAWIPHHSTLDTDQGQKCQYQGVIWCPGLCCGTLPNLDYLGNQIHACTNGYIIYLSYDINQQVWKLHITADYFFSFGACMCGGYSPQPGQAAGWVTCMWGLGYNDEPNEMCPCMPSERGWKGLAGCWCEGAPPQGIHGQVDACCGMTIMQATGINTATDIQNFCGCCGSGSQWMQPGTPASKDLQTDYWSSCYTQFDGAGNRFCKL